MKQLIILCLILPFLFACSQSENDTPKQQAEMIHQHDRCHQCGMMIKKYPGPKGQVHLRGESLVPKFCSTRDMFSFALQPENERQISSLMVHNMAITDWDHPVDSSFIDAKTAWYVYGTSKQAVMGPAIVPFESKDTAEQFAREFGGAVLQFEDIDLELIMGN
ncbi:nitrous oxide reductase accessory protein NosL [Shewanella eurypsychrophilus]|uniref:Nitrous oxide reductase accessory protein NosL n=1 Tax=Shewanella eurypsychrophilus TaxID=2593656 RepID=A0ABX6VB86_9GAMM|nr:MULTISPECIES: nitrous oxide reductase accessory protein NosL [Shewanella]QFU24685.1 nitrous oxide reductase accessory protein NosL [Shewanella sp. YLB-09]QPG59877.1 nitrous oxide reductase accessory protein NosL [Shewanella eurypsychrophilus]